MPRSRPKQWVRPSCEEPRSSAAWMLHRRSGDRGVGHRVLHGAPAGELTVCIGACAPAQDDPVHPPVVRAHRSRRPAARGVGLQTMPGRATRLARNREIHAGDGSRSTLTVEAAVTRGSDSSGSEPHAHRDEAYSQGDVLRLQSIHGNQMAERLRAPPPGVRASIETAPITCRSATVLGGDQGFREPAWSTRDVTDDPGHGGVRAWARRVSRLVDDLPLRKSIAGATPLEARSMLERSRRY